MRNLKSLSIFFILVFQHFFLCHSYVFFSCSLRFMFFYIKVKLKWRYIFVWYSKVRYWRSRICFSNSTHLSVNEISKRRFSGYYFCQTTFRHVWFMQKYPKKKVTKKDNILYALKCTTFTVKFLYNIFTISDQRKHFIANFCLHIWFALFLNLI